MQYVVYFSITVCNVVDFFITLQYVVSGSGTAQFQIGKLEAHWQVAKYMNV